MQQMLAARTPGLNFTRSGGDGVQESTVNVRGFSSMLNGNQPLIYVDGIRVYNSPADGGGSGGSALDHINPEDIESIEIIKGPAAEALYGSAAAAGVIQIVTKP
jgi:TonB-dependent SusC/RagA subfamily outer membrane receptor